MKRLLVTGGTGFIGARFVPLAVEAGYEVRVLTRRPQVLERWKALGVRGVEGDLLSPGPWQQEVAKSDVVAHLAQPPTYGSRVTRKRAEAYRDQRLRMDAHLLDALSSSPIQRILYVGGTSYYGNQGPHVVTEDTPPRPTGWGPYIAPAIESLPGYLARGLPLVEAYPGVVYGMGSWFVEYALKPLREGRLIFSIKEAKELSMSPIHVEDCARALLYLLEHGRVGQRYFVVDDEPAPFSDLVRLAAQTLGVRYRRLLLPRWLCALAMGPVVTDSLISEARLSNARLREAGYRFLYPTIREGVPALVESWLGASNHV